MSEVSKVITKDPATFKSEIVLRYPTNGADLETLELREFVAKASEQGTTINIETTNNNDGTSTTKLTYTPA